MCRKSALVSFLFVIFLAPFITKAQLKSYELSEPLDIPAAGWNRVLQMSNGNTLLFHFENRKGIVVKVFDVQHREIASKKYICKVLDIDAFERSDFEALFEVNGNASLFISQYIRNKRSLVRLDFDGVSGVAIYEEIIVRSPSFSNGYKSYILKGSEDTSGYAIITNKHLKDNPTEYFEIVKYNHENKIQVKVPIHVNKSDYTGIGLNKVHIDRKGDICVILILSKKVEYTAMPEMYLMVCYLPRGESKVITKRMQLEKLTIPAESYFSFNPLYKTLNLLQYSYARETIVENDIEKKVYSLQPLLMILDSANLSTINYGWYNGDSIKAYTKRIDTNIFFAGMPVEMYTKDNGSTTLVIEEHDVEYAYEAGARYVDRKIGNIGIAQYNYLGEETWGIVLPSRHTYRASNTPVALGKRYEEQFYRHDYLYNGDGLYIIFNDVNANYNKTLSDTLNEVYSYESANTTYYYIDKNKKVTKGTLFEEEGLYRYSVIQNDGNYDRKRGVYAALVAESNNGKQIFRIGWCKL